MLNVIKSILINPAVVVVVLCFSISSCVPAVAGIGAAAVTAGTTEKGLGTSVNDSIITVKIKEAFLKTDVDLLSGVSVQVNEGSVLLTGNIENPEAKSVATRIAWEVRDVVEVINEITVNDTSSIKDIAKDFAAAAQLRGKLIADGDISSINFSIDVINGTVFLSGIAASEEEMQRVVEHARSLSFAKEVANYIRVNDDKRR